MTTNRQIKPTFKVSLTISQAGENSQSNALRHLATTTSIYIFYVYFFDDLEISFDDLGEKGWQSKSSLVVILLKVLALFCATFILDLYQWPVYLWQRFYFLYWKLGVNRYIKVKKFLNMYLDLNIFVV